MPGKVLRVGLLTPIANLNPREAQDFSSALVVSQVFETPYAPPKPGEPPQPVLFQERLRQDAPDVLSAALRPGVKFWDGTPLTAQHVVDSLGKAKAFNEQAAASADGDRVVFRLKRPNARFDQVLTRRYCGVTLDGRGAPQGTGPYMPAPGSTPEQMRLVVNPHHRQRPEIDEIVFQLYPTSADGSPEALLKALDAGEVDFCNVLSREDIMRLKSVRRWTEPGSSTAILYLNTERPGLADARVRRILALSIDRLEIAKMFYSSAMAFAATSLLPPMLGRGNDGLAPDAAKLRALLSSPGLHLPDRLRLLLIFGPRPYLPNPRRVAEYVVAQIGKLGIAVDIVPTASSQEYYQQVGRGDYDMVLAGWIADTMDPTDFLEATLASSSIPAGGSTVVNANLGHFRNAEVDEALAKLRQEPREEIRTQILRRIGEEVPLIPLIYGATICVHSWRVKNFTPNPLGKPNFAELGLQD
jgi:peptide/nickel transport system substrate-binding protein